MRTKKFAFEINWPLVVQRNLDNFYSQNKKYTVQQIIAHTISFAVKPGWSFLLHYKFWLIFIRMKQKEKKWKKNPNGQFKKQRFSTPPILKILLKYGFCKKSLRKNEILTSWTLLAHFFSRSGWSGNTARTIALLSWRWGPIG